ncbi:MAG: hypothetical protein V4858_02355 [Pseudomonadota bacterium]
MNLLFELVTGILRAVAKVVLIALTAVFALGVLCVGLAVVAVLVLRFLLTGRKPAVFTTMTRFNQAAQQFRPGFRPGGATVSRQDSADVVDVEAHEVRTVLNAPSSSKPAD